MVLGTTGNHGISQFDQFLRQRVRVFLRLHLILFEFVGLRVLQRDAQRGDLVVVRPALVAREDGSIDGALEIVPVCAGLLACEREAVSLRLALDGWRGLERVFKPRGHTCTRTSVYFRACACVRARAIECL